MYLRRRLQDLYLLWSMSENCRVHEVLYIQVIVLELLFNFGKIFLHQK